MPVDLLNSVYIQDPDLTIPPALQITTRESGFSLTSSMVSSAKFLLQVSGYSFRVTRFLSCGAALRCGVAGVLLLGASIHVLVRLCWPCCSSVLVTCFDAWLSISVRCLRILLQFMFYVVCLYCVLGVALNFLPSSSQLVGCCCRLRCLSLPCWPFLSPIDTVARFARCFNSLILLTV